MTSSKYFGLQGHLLSRLQTALIVAPSFILFGYNQAGIGGLITQNDWVKTFPEIDTVHAVGSEKSEKSTLQGFVVAVFVIGALFGALSCSYTGDRFGRRNVIFFAGLCTLIGEILEASSFGLPQFIVGRVIVGLGVGQLSSLVPVWQSETAGAKNRGRHVVLDGLFICLGYVLESWINLGFFELKTGPVTWRPPIAIACVFSLVLICSIYMFPESPRWLLMTNKSELARENLAILRGLPQDASEVSAEIEGIELSLELSADGGAKLSQIFKMGEDKLAYRFGLCILLQFYQQMSGSNLISVYAPILFQENLGLSSEMSRILSAGALTWKFLSSFLAFVAIDRFGRRAVFMVSGAGMSCCMIALAVATSFPTSNRASQIAAGCFIYLYNMFVPIGFLGANFLYCTEVAPLRLRMAMSSISTANHWAWNFLVAMVTPVAIYSIGWQYYIVFAVVAACVPVSVYFLFPETMGRSLEEIDLMFKDSPSALATVRFEKQLRRAGTPTLSLTEKNKLDHSEG
ncbi:putative sugar transporter [Daldinia loculata]|uniref:putative sugar transporter n=1 Tax=Daldinia loculata TaxID=103429 RepID=UPI0020C3ED27|nr:putative sugar transporter [Daldinia loculata]KAI1651275.1 putative sugar transporter [Daldinia loculata]KAI2777564.1 putative sugar transporter [Daldinia loculata]